VYRAVVTDELHYSFNEIVSLEIGQRDRLFPRPTVTRCEGVTTGAAQRTFVGDLYRKERFPTAKDSPPNGENIPSIHLIPAFYPHTQMEVRSLWRAKFIEAFGTVNFTPFFSTFPVRAHFTQKHLAA
jgi:hypothetical protein